MRCAIPAMLLLATLGGAGPQTAPSLPATQPSSQPAAGTVGEVRATTSPATTAPADAPWSRGLEDEQVGRAIQHGVDFLLTQLKNGDLTTAPELSDSQRQSLDALCVYALLQSGQAINDPRLSPRGPLIPQLLNRLRTFDLVSDAQKTNRPITYGRSLRAAALATLNRPEDRAVLKADVEWLIKAQIGGAYSYDDLYSDLIKQGLKPTSFRFDPRSVSGAVVGAGASDVSAPVLLVQDFGGGSGDPGLGGGPYGPPVSPLPPVSPVPMIPTPGGGGGGGGGGPKGPPPQHPYQIVPTPERMTPRPPIFEFPRPIVTWGRPTPGGTTPSAPQNGGYIGPKTPNGGGYIGPSVKPKPSTAPPSGGGVFSPSERPLGDTQIPKTTFQFEFPWDNSNSQYGLLGVWAGAEVGIEVPDPYWQAVEKHWIACQLRTGQWSYRKADVAGTFAMTCAGVASLLVTHEYLDLPMLKGQVAREPYNRNLAQGFAWLDKGNNGVETPTAATHYFGYDLFGIERVGLASGYKYFGNHDWYREMSDVVVKVQFPNGAWGHEDHGIDTVVDTAYTLLFLARGRHPILMTKLKFEKYWDNRPRDAANLARFATRELERQVNWQTVGIDHPWNDWFDSPVVYIASHQAPKLTPKQFAELQKFVQAGGLIFTQADMSAANFDAWVPELAKRIAPGMALRPIPDNDPIYSLQYKLPTHRKLLGVSNGVRWLLVHSPNDMALAWQQRSDKTRLQDFQLGLNIFFYATGKPDLKNRIDSPYIPDPPAVPTRSTRVARVQFAGNWNPEPAAWGRFARWLQWETGESLTIGSVPMEKLTPGVVPIASLTGAGKTAFTKPELDATAAYVKAGGLLLIDSTGGDNTFRLAVRDELLPAFAGAKPEPLPAELSAPMRLRPFSLERLGRAAPPIQLMSYGKGHVVFSGLDLTHALLGTNTWAVDGYQPEAAQAFLKNLVAWSGHQ